MIIDYNSQPTFTDSIDIVDIGNTCLRLTSRDNLDYYISTKTIMGKTAILKFGPVLPDVAAFLDSFFVDYKKIDYKENKIVHELSSLINDPKKHIINVEEIVEPELFMALPDIENNFMEL